MTFWVTELLSPSAVPAALYAVTAGFGGGHYRRGQQDQAAHRFRPQSAGNGLPLRERQHTEEQ